MAVLVAEEMVGMSVEIDDDVHVWSLQFDQFPREDVLAGGQLGSRFANLRGGV
jgi:hypothetical protein